MTHSLPLEDRWNSRRFGAIIPLLFILQVGLIWAFAERARKPPALNPPPFSLCLLPQPVALDRLATTLFAEDPTLFLAPSWRGFSGRASRLASSPEYHAAVAPVPDVWLSLDASAWKPKALSMSGQDELPLTLATPPGAEFAPSAIFLEPDPAPSGSAFRVEGSLASRRIVPPAVHLPAQSSAQLLRQTVVQIAVDPAGEVVSAHLAGNSGSPGADALALATARTLRFEPLSVPSDSAGWGNIVFSWQTVEPVVAAGK